MTRIAKLTLGYDPSEDRILIDAQLEDGSGRRLWLTQRLVAALVPQLCGWLDNHLARTASGHHDNRLHAFEQRSAAASVTPAKPVDPSLTASAGSLIQAVDLRRGNNAVRLVFRGRDEASGPEITFGASRLRQWLGMLRGICGNAGWPAGFWPKWLSPEVSQATLPPRSLH